MQGIPKCYMQNGSPGKNCMDFQVLPKTTSLLLLLLLLLFILRAERQWEVWHKSSFQRLTPQMKAAAGASWAPELHPGFPWAEKDPSTWAAICCRKLNEKQSSSASNQALHYEKWACSPAITLLCQMFIPKLGFQIHFFHALFEVLLFLPNLSLKRKQSRTTHLVCCLPSL